MTEKTKKPLYSILAGILAYAMFLPVVSAAPALTASAEESIGNGVILSTDAITVTEDATASFTAVLGEGADASRLVCVVANPDVASVTLVAFAENTAAFEVCYGNSGSTVAAVYYLDNPEVIAYLDINATAIIMEIPAKLGTNHDNYCQLVSYEFEPYELKYSELNDYKHTLNIRYQCVSYEDQDFVRWGCYGRFYDEAGNVLSKVHLYCSTLAKGRVYHSEFHVPVNAVRFAIEGFE